MLDARSQSKASSVWQMVGTSTAYCSAMRTFGSWRIWPSGVPLNSVAQVVADVHAAGAGDAQHGAVPLSLTAWCWSGGTLVMMSTLPAISSAERVDASGMTFHSSSS